MKTPLIANEEIIAGVNSKIIEILGDELEILSRLKKYVVNSGGKRVRSLIGSYLSEIFGCNIQDSSKISAIVEIIHAASLLHDDVLDDSSTRRGKPSGKMVFGAKEVILGGDYMFATAIRSLNDYENPGLMDIFTRVIRDLSIGELYQLEFEKNPDITIDDYYKIIYGKTGSLFQTACEGIAIFSERKPDEIKLAAEVGRALGILFQIRDDFLDYFNADLLQKSPYQDFENGLYTYPLLIVRDQMNKEDRETVKNIFSLPEEKRKDPEIRNTFLTLLEKYKTREVCLKNLNDQKNKLFENLYLLPAHPFRDKIENQIKKLMELD